jgi:RNA polymerase sigma-70 factor, ECF subfamily
MPILGEDEIEKLRPKVRFRLAQQVGFACADLDDLVQDTLARFLVAVRQDKVRDPAFIGGFLNGICRNVVLEYRRRLVRGDSMPEIIGEPVEKRLSGAEQFEIREAIAAGMAQLSQRDREILRALYFEEKTKEEILERYNLTDQRFRVILCRAKERFRAIYLGRLKQSSGGSQ